MNWGKFVLIFQAVITLVIGAIFFFSVISLDDFDFSSEDLMSSEVEDNLDIKARFEVAAYVILFVSLIELLVLSRVSLG